MANAYTSVNTTGSLVDALVKTAYDTQVGYNLRAYPTARQFVDRRPISPSMRGSSIVLTKYSDFSAAAITAAKTPLTEEASPDSVKMPAPTTVTVTPNEYGFVVIRTEKLYNRTFTDIDPEIARAVAYHMTCVIDELIQDVFVTATNVEYAGSSNAADADVAVGDVLTAALVRKQRTLLVTANALPWSGGYYGALVHPTAVHDLRQETGSGGWRVPNEYGSSQEKIWSGEFGEFEGFRFVQNNRVRERADAGTSSADLFENYFFGRGSFVEERRIEPQTVLGPEVDPLRRFRTVGWKGDIGWAIYEQNSFRRVVSANSLGQ